jgi:aryl-alcohol dehydrogenase-like predicted oxidoreductase
LPRIATIQNLYNLTARHYETSLLDETCYRENVSLLAYSPLAFGQLTAKYHRQSKGAWPPEHLPAELEPALPASGRGGSRNRYAKLARDSGLTPTQLALAWCYSRWFVASTIIGATNLDQLKHATSTPTRSSAGRHQQVDQIHAEITGQASNSKPYQ